MPRNQLEVTAYHEIGHVISAWCCGIDVAEVSIIPTNDMLGYTLCNFTDEQKQKNDNDDPAFIKKLIIRDLGGMTADYTHWGQDASFSDDELRGHWSDQSNAQRHLSRLGLHGATNLNAFVGISLTLWKNENHVQLLHELSSRLLESKHLKADQLSKFSGRVELIKDDFIDYVFLVLTGKAN